MELFPASGPVKTKIIGAITDQKEEQALRIQQHMNYLLTEKMTEFRPETEQMLFSLPLAGSSFKKVYYDPAYVLTSFRQRTLLSPTGHPI